MYICSLPQVNMPESKLKNAKKHVDTLFLRCGHCRAVLAIGSKDGEVLPGGQRYITCPFCGGMTNATFAVLTKEEA